MGIYGQDWASYQASEPNVAGLDFAFVKVTEGTGYTNPKWVRQRDHAKRNGLVWGAYHYPHMAGDPKAEADFFLAQVAWQPGDIIVLDWEGYDDANQGVSKARQLAYKEAWLRYVKAKMPGHRVGMYCSVDYWKNVDTTGYCGDFLWIASGGRKAGDPGIKADWLFHQYSDTPVDKDYCPLPSREALRAWATLTSPTPEEDSVTPEDIKAIAAAVWNYELPNLNADGSRTGTTKAAYWWLVWQDVFQNQTINAIREAALTPDQIKQALIDGTLKVEVSVVASTAGA
ncbi:glycoside hydrolase family 25 protein [Streptomyces sp. NPDC059708]|uniref:glycoside hydrolase family 25 protein n=1 Tax=Streptomyces sp. NPDC059708 TaxID=3346916 RepID=UPI00368D7CDA